MNVCSFSSVMLKCWQFEPEGRLGFGDLFVEMERRHKESIENEAAEPPVDPEPSSMSAAVTENMNESEDVYEVPTPKQSVQSIFSRPLRASNTLERLRMTAQGLCATVPNLNDAYAFS